MACQDAGETAKQPVAFHGLFLFDPFFDPVLIDPHVFRQVLEE